MGIASAVITLLVGVATFLIGMKMMSSGIKKVAGKGLKRIFRKTQNSSLAGLGIGALVAGIIQSCAGTSVMAVGFINAGIMTVFQGVSVMMGSYIGTNMTGILVSLSSSSFNITIYLTALAFVGVVLMFFKNEKVVHIGEMLAGLGLLFFGLSTMSGAFKGSAEINNAFTNLFANVNFPLLLFIFGILLAMLLQSSSASIGIVIVMVGSKVILFSSALYVAIGAMVGTVMTTVLGTIGTNTNAKRATLIIVLIRVITGLIGLAIAWIFEAQLCPIFANNFGSEEFGLAILMVIYNIIFMVGLLPLIKPLEKVAEKMIVDKADIKKAKAIQFIDNRFLATPEIALSQAKKEIVHMFILSRKNFELGYEYFVNDKAMDEADFKNREDEIDYINSRLTSYLVDLSSKTSLEEAKVLGSYFHVINDIERIGDHAYNFYDHKKEMVEKEISFSTVAKEELNNFYYIILKMFDLTDDIFENVNKDELDELKELEEKTDSLNHQYASNHYQRLQKNECSSELSPYFSTLLSELERVSDHLTNIGYSIVNPVGDEE